MSEDLYWRLHALSKVLESSGLVDELQHARLRPYGTILDAMNAVRSEAAERLKNALVYGTSHPEAMTDDLTPLPCPFCGHIGLDFKEGTTFRWLSYSCGGCGAGNETRIQTLGEGTPEQWRAQAKSDAVAEWNRRAAVSGAADPVGLPAGELTGPVSAAPTLPLEPAACGHEACDCRGYCKKRASQPPREPLSDEQIRDLVKECGLDWHRGFMPLFDGDETNRYAVFARAVLAASEGKT